MRTDQVFAVLTLGALVPAAQGGSGPSIRIRVVDVASVSKVSVTEAEKQAGAILARAGIQVVWQECPGAQGACTQPLVANAFQLTISDWRPPGTTAGMLGFAEIGGDDPSAAGIYYPTAKRTASDFGVDEVLVLGAAFAHEIGHLLGEGHSSAGVMRTRFNRQSFIDIAQGGMVFDPEQTVRIRAAAVRRSLALIAPTPESLSQQK